MKVLQPLSALFLLSLVTALPQPVEETAIAESSGEFLAAETEITADTSLAVEFSFASQEAADSEALKELGTIKEEVVVIELDANAESAAENESSKEDGASFPEVATVAAAAVPRCWTRLSCTFSQIQVSSMASRLAYVRYMQSRHFGPLGGGNKFRAIEAVIDWFIAQRVGRPGTWISYVDAGIVEAIQRGGAIALGKSSATGGNPGAPLWADYFRKLRAGQLRNRDAHDPAWSKAEQAGTDYGRKKAETTRGVSGPTNQQRQWYNFTQLFRIIMRNRGKIIRTIRIIFWFNRPLANGAEKLINWFTDVTNFKATRIGVSISWNLSGFLFPFNTSATAILAKVGLLKDFFLKLWDAYQ